MNLDFDVSSLCDLRQTLTFLSILRLQVDLTIPTIQGDHEKHPGNVVDFLKSELAFLTFHIYLIFG